MKSLLIIVLFLSAVTAGLHCGGVDCERYAYDSCYDDKCCHSSGSDFACLLHAQCCSGICYMDEKGSYCTCRKAGMHCNEDKQCCSFFCNQNVCA